VRPIRRAVLSTEGVKRMATARGFIQACDHRSPGRKTIWLFLGTPRTSSSRVKASRSANMAPCTLVPTISEAAVNLLTKISEPSFRIPFFPILTMI